MGEVANKDMLIEMMNMDSSAGPGFLVAGQDEDVQQELDTYVELGQRRGRGTQVRLLLVTIAKKIVKLNPNRTIHTAGRARPVLCL